MRLILSEAALKAFNWKTRRQQRLTGQIVALTAFSWNIGNVNAV